MITFYVKLCYPNCQSASDCPQGFDCFKKSQCQKLCSSDQECLESQYCNIIVIDNKYDLACEEKCKADYDCQIGQMCSEEGKCLNKCSKTKDCNGSNKYCHQ